MIDFAVVDLSRLQFALTALYHFLFVPLTLGLSMMLVIMEATYVMTGREIWKRMTKFWGLLFGINFAMGVATGITMEFQFGTNWAYYSHYVGDMFGAPLAIEGPDGVLPRSRPSSACSSSAGTGCRSSATWSSPAWSRIGSNFSALWILIANGWMQNPVGAEFNSETMRMEVTSFVDVIFNPVAQAKFVHTVSAGYVTGAIFVLAISAWYLLRGRNLGLRQALDRGRGELRPCVRAVGRRAGRRERLHAHRTPEDEDRRDRGHVGDRAGAGVVHAVRRSRISRSARPHAEIQHSVGARA